MEHRATTDFWKWYQELPAAAQVRAAEQFALLQADPKHPSVQFKKVGERFGNEIWSARDTLSYRALAIKRPDGYLWFWIGDQDRYEGILG